jgi:hypothetical protein
MLFSERAGGRKAGGPPLLAPSFKVQRNTAHNQSSRFRRRSRRPQRLRWFKGPRIAGTICRTPALIARATLAALVRGPARHPSHPTWGMLAPVIPVGRRPYRC